MDCLRLDGLGGGSRTSSSRDGVHESARIATVPVFVVGLILAFHFLSSASTDTFELVVRMIDVDSGSASTGLLAKAMICVCWLTMLAGAFGVLALHWDHRSMISIYLVWSCVLLLLYVWAFAYGWVMNTSLTPVLTRQYEEFCRGELHDLYYAELECTGRGAAPKRAAACSEACLARVGMLTEMGGSHGGCSFLEALCHEFEYTRVGRGACLVAAAPPGRRAVPAPVAVLGRGPEVREGVVAMCCQDACDVTESCAGYSHGGEACRLVAEARPSHVLQGAACRNFTWRVVASGDPAPARGGLSVVSSDFEGRESCYRKELTTQFGENIAITSVWLTAGSLVAISSLLVAVATACLHQYSLTTRRRGRKSAAALMCKLLCPCSSQKARVKRVNGKPLVAPECEGRSPSSEGTESDEEDNAELLE